MADLILPAFESAHPGRSQIVGTGTFDGVSIIIRLSMNPSSFRWSANIQDAVGRDMIEGHALVDRADVLTPYRATYAEAIPPGALFAMSISGDGSDPSGFLAWRTTHKMVYRTVA